MWVRGDGFWRQLINHSKKIGHKIIAKYSSNLEENIIEIAKGVQLPLLEGDLTRDQKEEVKAIVNHFFNEIIEVVRFSSDPQESCLLF